MKTVMFIETPQDKSRMVVGFPINKNNYLLAPKGTIRIARFENAFWPDNENIMCYYGDIYLKLFIKKWKKIFYQNKHRRRDILLGNLLLFNKEVLFPNDINNHIKEFL